jgi:hypothetical protein
MVSILTRILLLLMEEQINMLMGVDGMEHGVWGYMDSQLDKRWKQFQESFNND